jgi:hypothetical protein
VGGYGSHFRRGAEIEKGRNLVAGAHKIWLQHYQARRPDENADTHGNPICAATQKLKWVSEHRKRARMIQALDAKTIEELQIQFNEVTPAQMWEKMQRTPGDTTRAIENGVDFVALAPTAEVVKVGDQIWTVKDFQERAIQTSARQRSRVQNVDDLKDFISGLALREEYLRRAKRAGFEKDPKVRQLIRSKEESFLIEKMKALLTDSVRVPMDTLRQAYAAQPENYTHPAMARLREITVANRHQSEYLCAKPSAEWNLPNWPGVIQFAGGQPSVAGKWVTWQRRFGRAC